MAPSSLRSVVQWILVICCAEAVSVPAAAFTSVLTPVAALQIQDERETETVAVAAAESRRGVEPPPPQRCIRAAAKTHGFTVSSTKCRTEFDGRAELRTRFLSLRC